MSLPKNVVSVDLGNLPRPVALDLLDASAGASVVAYADPSGHARLTLPYSASDTDGTVVKFYVDADEVWLSAKVNGHEVADAGGTTKYVVADPHRSDAAPVVQLEWNADRLNQAAPSGGSSSLPVVQLTSTSGWVIGTSQPSAWLDAGSAGGTALTPDAAAGTITVNENGFYLVLARLSTVVCTAAGYLTLDDTNGRFLVDRSLPISTYGATLSVSDLVFQPAGTVMALEVYTGDGALTGHGGNVDLYVTQIAKSAI